MKKELPPMMEIVSSYSTPGAARDHNGHRCRAWTCKLACGHEVVLIWRPSRSTRCPECPPPKVGRCVGCRRERRLTNGLCGACSQAPGERREYPLSQDRELLATWDAHVRSRPRRVVSTGRHWWR